MCAIVDPDPGLDRRPFPDFLDGPAESVAEKLLGCFLERSSDDWRAMVRIVETEAYDQDDAASHSFRGETPRTEVMFGGSGRLYVYFSYGMHHCCNVVCGPAGYGSAALIRGVEPVEGGQLLEARRGVPGVDATNGPAKLCQALEIDLDLNGHDLRRAPLRLLHGDLSADEEVIRTPRIGITKEAERLRRFCISGNRYVSGRRV